MNKIISIKEEKLMFLLLFVWGILNLVQGAFTELLHDEAYYWVYSKDLDWGYFDHPPFLAVLIKMGYTIFPNELGVRLFITLISTTTLWIIWKIIDDTDFKLFFLLAASTVIIHVGGFVAVPDIPLVFFSALFFLFFKHYLEKDDWWTVLGLTIATIGMAYSKYQGALVFFFAVLSSLFLLKRKSFWLMVVVVSLALIPHLHWQYIHEFPTFRYQLLDRSQVPYKFEFFINYILGQLLIFGPFIGVLLFYASFKFKPKTPFEKTLKWCFYGFFGFFFIQSMRGRIEPNWTVMGVTPLLYFGYYMIKDNENLRKWTKRLAIPTLVIVGILRIYLMIDFLPKGTIKPPEFHDNKAWANDLSAAAGDLPVIFHNTYQRPSKYMFYSGKTAHSVNGFNYAGKEYDLMTAVEEELQGKKVFRIHQGAKATQSIQLSETSNYKYEVVDSFYYFNRVKIDIPEPSYTMPLSQTMPIEVSISNPTDKSIDFEPHLDKLQIEYCFFWYGREQYCKPVAVPFPVKKLAPREKFKTQLSITSPDKEDKHWRFRFAIRYDDFLGRNSNFTKLRIE